MSRPPLAGKASSILMLRRVLMGRMRLALPILMLAATAGCFESPAASTTLPQDEPAEALVETVHLDGIVWLPSSSGQEREETPVELPANATGLRIAASLLLGSTYAGANAPALLADVIVQIQDAAGEALAEAHLTMDAPTAQIEAVTADAGGATLMVLSYGGSDGSANGDHVSFGVEIAPGA